MRSTRSWITGSALAVLVAGATFAGCKQGEGEVCQIDDDCEGDLICNASNMQCQRPGAGTVDAAPTPDAPPPVDAGAADAPAEIDAGMADAGEADAS